MIHLLKFLVMSVPVVKPEMYPLHMDARVIVYHGKQYLAIYTQSHLSCTLFSVEF